MWRRTVELSNAGNTADSSSGQHSLISVIVFRSHTLYDCRKSLSIKHILSFLTGLYLSFSLSLVLEPAEQLFLFFYFLLGSLLRSFLPSFLRSSFLLLSLLLLLLLFLPLHDCGLFLLYVISFPSTSACPSVGPFARARSLSLRHTAWHRAHSPQPGPEAQSVGACGPSMPSLPFLLFSSLPSTTFVCFQCARPALLCSFQRIRRDTRGI
jgi:hypothetical protein